MSSIKLVKGYSMPPGGPGMDYGRFAAHRAMGAFYGALQPAPSSYYYADKRRMPADTFAPLPRMDGYGGGCGCSGQALGDDATVVATGSMLPVLAAAGLGIFLLTRHARRRRR